MRSKYLRLYTHGRSQRGSPVGYGTPSPGYTF